MWCNCAYLVGPAQLTLNTLSLFIYLIFPHITNLISGRFYYKVTAKNLGPGASFAKQIAYKIVLHVL